MVNMTDIIFPIGARVRLLGSTGMTGKVVEHRGALGPKGAQVYRVRYRGKPRPAYVEVLADQLELLPPKEKPSVAAPAPGE